MTRILLMLALIPGLALADPLDVALAKADALDADLKTAEALVAYLEAEKLAPDNAYIQIRLAKQYGESMVDAKSKSTQQSLAETAMQHASKALALEPNMCDAHLAVAICYGRLFDFVSPKKKIEYSKGIKSHAETAVKLDPNSDYAWHMLGRWHQSVCSSNKLLRGLAELGGVPKGSLEKSVECFEKAVEIEPNRVAHQIELGRTYALMGKTEEAKSAINKGLALPDKERDDPDTKARGRETLAEL